MNHKITCAEFEIRLADLLDDTLRADEKLAVEDHAASCAACAELARDASGAMTFIERAAEVAPPPVLINRILAASAAHRIEAAWLAREESGRVRNSARGRFGQWLGTVLQPRFAMGVAMAAISLAMLGRFGPAAEVGIERAWDRAMKNYDNMQLVYQVRNQWQEWSQENGLDRQ
jgi:anti-sigma factor RsiW